jgi:DNA-binding transcriptional ArsR family regulator
MKETEALAALAALAHPMRVAIFRMLVRAGEGGMIAGDIGAALEVPASTLSANLAILTRAGLASSTREGRAIRYRADLAGAQALMRFLVEDCCDGRPELCRPVLEMLGARR